MTDGILLPQQTANLLALKERYVPAVYQQHHPVIARQGEGAWVCRL